MKVCHSSFAFSLLDDLFFIFRINRRCSKCERRLNNSCQVRVWLRPLVHLLRAGVLSQRHPRCSSAKAITVHHPRALQLWRLLCPRCLTPYSLIPRNLMASRQIFRTTVCARSCPSPRVTYGVGSVPSPDMVLPPSEGPFLLPEQYYPSSNMSQHSRCLVLIVS